MTIIEQLARELNRPAEHIENVVRLLDEGNTIQEPEIRLDLSKGDEYILNQLAQLWNGFTTC